MKDLIKPLREMTDDELRARLVEIRHNRKTARPAKADHERREKKKGATTRINKSADLLAGLSDAEKAELIAKLKGDLL